MLRLPLSHPVTCIDVIMNSFQFGSNSPKSFQAYPNKGDFDLESGTIRKPRKPKRSAVSCPMTMVKSLGKRLHYYYELHPLLVFFVSFTFGVTILVLLSLYESRYRTQFNYRNIDIISDDNPFAKLKNLVMVAGHSVYTSSSCEKADKDDSWFLEPYQKHPGQASTFLEHIQDGVEVAAIDEEALLLFSGGETRRDAGPRSEAQSYWAVAESKGWFGKQDNVRWRALTEEHARDSFENLLFSVCRFRELTGIYPHNITVISYDFKEERFGNLHRDAIRFPEGRFFFSGTPVSSTSKVAATKGEALVRAQFQQDPYGCLGSLRRKKIGRDPFHRSIPYPSGCPEIEGLFRYCGPVPYSGSLPW